MARLDGSLARTLDFGDGAGPSSPTAAVHAGGGRAGLRLALPGGVLRGPDKYKVLERRRRHAQIAARRVLAAFEAAGQPQDAE
jgi:hypothetical protein